MGKGGSSGSSSPSGSTTTTQQQSPWVGQVPFIQGGGQAGGGTPTGIPQGTGQTGGTLQPGNVTPGVLPLASSLYQNYVPQYFPGSTVSPLNPVQQGSLGQQAMLGKQGGNSATNSAGNALTAFNQGDFLSAGNPYFKQMANTIGQNVSPIVNSQFEQNGRYGSGSNVNALTSNLTNEIGNLAGTNYEQGLSNMLQSSQASPSNLLSQITAEQTGLGAGNQMQQQSQAELNNQINQWNFQQQLPYNMLSTYQQMVNGNYGGGSTLTQPYFAQNSGGKGGGGGKSTGSTIMSVAEIAALAAFA